MTARKGFIHAFIDKGGDIRALFMVGAFAVERYTENADEYKTNGGQYREFDSVLPRKICDCGIDNQRKKD